MKIKLSETNACVFFMTLLVFLDMEPFFVWSSVSPLGYRIYTAVIVITTVFMGYMAFLKKHYVASPIPGVRERNRVPAPLLVASATIVVLFFYKVYVSGVVTRTQQPFNMAMLCIHLGLMLFALQDNVTLRRVFILSKKIFAITLIPSIFVFLLLQVGFPVPVTSLTADAGKDMVGQSYQLYLGTATMIQNSGVLLNRVCGIYREPGFVGTIGVLFLLGDKMSLRKWENAVILVACIFTFSLAFIVMLILGILLRSIGNMKKKSSMIISLALILLIVVGYFVFMHLPLDESSMLGELQGRLEITDEGLAGDNRFGSSIWAMDAYDAFLKSSTRVKMLGYGEDLRIIPGTKVSIWQTVHSYKEFVFAYGFVGLIILVFNFLSTVILKYRKVPKYRFWNILVLLVVFIVSIYQRYGVDSFHYYCVLFGGASNLALLDIKDVDDKKEVVFRWKK